MLPNDCISVPPDSETVLFLLLFMVLQGCTCAPPDSEMLFFLPFTRVLIFVLRLASPACMAVRGLGEMEGRLWHVGAPGKHDDSSKAVAPAAGMNTFLWTAACEGDGQGGSKVNEGCPNIWDP